MFVLLWLWFLVNIFVILKWRFMLDQDTHSNIYTTLQSACLLQRRRRTSDLELDLDHTALTHFAPRSVAGSLKFCFMFVGLDCCCFINNRSATWWLCLPTCINISLIRFKFNTISQFATSNNKLTPTTCESPRKLDQYIEESAPPLWAFHKAAVLPYLCFGT